MLNLWKLNQLVSEKVENLGQYHCEITFIIFIVGRLLEFLKNWVAGAPQVQWQQKLDIMLKGYLF